MSDAFKPGDKVIHNMFITLFINMVLICYVDFYVYKWIS